MTEIENRMLANLEEVGARDIAVRRGYDWHHLNSGLNPSYDGVADGFRGDMRVAINAFLGAMDGYGLMFTPRSED